MFCAFFKQGLCKKGDKCKFSHDPAVERKSAKRNIYLDAVDGKEEDLMDTWDEEKLQDVVNKKHGAEKTNQTDIVSLESSSNSPRCKLWAEIRQALSYHSFLLRQRFSLENSRITWPTFS